MINRATHGPAQLDATNLIEEIETLRHALRRCMRAIRNLDLDEMGLAHVSGYHALNGDIDVREEPVS